MTTKQSWIIGGCIIAAAVIAPASTTFSRSYADKLAGCVDSCRSERAACYERELRAAQIRSSPPLFPVLPGEEEGSEIIERALSLMLEIPADELAKFEREAEAICDQKHPCLRRCIWPY